MATDNFYFYSCLISINQHAAATPGCDFENKPYKESNPWSGTAQKNGLYASCAFGILGVLPLSSLKLCVLKNKYRSFSGKSSIQRVLAQSWAHVSIDATI